MVIGATNRKGRLRKEFELITTTGRIFAISAPLVGFKSTNQISPRNGEGLIFDEVTAAYILVFIVLRKFLCLLFENISTLYY